MAIYLQWVNESILLHKKSIDAKHWPYKVWQIFFQNKYFSTQSSKYFLVDYIDDVAPVVDEYMLVRVEKMYKKAFKTQNRLTSVLKSERLTHDQIKRMDKIINEVNATASTSLNEN